MGGAECETVVGEADVGWEVFFGLGVREFVCHVYEVGLCCSDLERDGMGLADSEVGRVFAVAECVEDECVESSEVFPGLGGDRGDIGAVGERPPRVGGAVCVLVCVCVWVCGFDSPAEYWEFSVEESEWREVEAEEGDGLVWCDEVWDDRGDERVVVDVVFFVEDVFVDTPEVFHGVWFCVEVYWCAHDGVESSDLVEAEGVVYVVVCEEDGVASWECCAECLLSEVRSCVEEDDALVAEVVVVDDGCARAESGVTGVF